MATITGTPNQNNRIIGRDASDGYEPREPRTEIGVEFETLASVLDGQRDNYIGSPGNPGFVYLRGQSHVGHARGRFI